MFGNLSLVFSFDLKNRNSFLFLKLKNVATILRRFFFTLAANVCFIAGERFFAQTVTSLYVPFIQFYFEFLGYLKDNVLTIIFFSATLWNTIIPNVLTAIRLVKIIICKNVLVNCLFKSLIFLFNLDNFFFCLA